MTDQTTKRRLAVSGGGTAAAYIMVPLSQLDAVQKLLDAHQVSYWPDELAISLDGEPEVVFINLGRGADPDKVQQFLDSAP